MPRRPKIEKVNRNFRCPFCDHTYPKEVDKFEYPSDFLQKGDYYECPRCLEMKDNPLIKYIINVINVKFNKIRLDFDD